MTNVSRTNRNGLRPASDFYPTPFDAVLAFLRHELRILRRLRKFWEPAAGDDAIVKVAESLGLKAVATDLHNHGGRAKGGRDFLKERLLLAAAIITNPPFNIANRFVQHALDLGARYVAMLLPITFLAGLGRRGLLEGVTNGLRLARVLVLAWRCTMKPKRVKLQNGGVVTYAWFVWTRGHKGPPVIGRLYRDSDMVTA